jgi:predicted RNA-binding protein with TRAM domain
MVWTRRRSQARSGIILIVVLSLLVLFSAVGLAFVLYSSSQAEAGRAWRTSQNVKERADFEPDRNSIINAALGQVIYDVDTPASGQNGSMVWGHSLARSIYGWNAISGSMTTTPENVSPYAGQGILRNAIPSVPGVGEDALLINYAASANMTTVPTRRPEEYSGSYVGKHADYTYPDLNNVYLTAMDMRGDLVTMNSDPNQPLLSFYRPEAFGTLAPSNPNWTNTAGKHLILRPRTQDHPNFPAITANPDGTYTGDVENIDNKPVRKNDAIWVDHDLPVQNWNGKKYKPLVAWTIIDLDGKIDLNVAGNQEIVATQDHGANQGYGPWETNPGANDKISCFADMQRHLTQRKPNGWKSFDGKTSTPIVEDGRFYSLTDTDADATARITTPSTATPYSTSYQYGSLYNNSFAGERGNNPASLNPFYLTNKLQNGRASRIYEIDEIARLYGVFNESSGYNPDRFKTSKVFENGTQKMQKEDFSTDRLNPRFGVTTLSASIERIATPTTPLPSGGFKLSLTAALPSLGTAVSLTLGDIAGATNTLADLGAIDLNRHLTDFRSDLSKDWKKNDGVDPSSGQFARAMNDRKRVAQDIFDRLVLITGARQQPLSLSVAGMPVLGSEEYDALRWLAQLSVNIVDYIDNDDVMTILQWNPNDQNQYVVGVELPRLVINEVYSQLVNDPTDSKQQPITNLPQAQKDYQLQMWVELLNPLTPPDTTWTNFPTKSLLGSKAYLRMDGVDIYRMVVLRNPDAQLNLGNLVTVNLPSLRDNPNGAPSTPDDLPVIPSIAKQKLVLSLVEDSDGDDGDDDHHNDNDAYVDTNKVNDKGNGKSRGNGGSNPGFYVIGPDRTPGDHVKVSFKNPKMKFGVSRTAIATPRPSYLLQRLANPFLDPNDPADTSYNASKPINPYVTTDCVETPAGGVWDHREVTVVPGSNPGFKPYCKHYSFGKVQPYFGSSTNLKKLEREPGDPWWQDPAGTDDDHPHTTFFRHNFWDDGSGAKVNGGQPFEVLGHLDRKLVNPIELFGVATCKPTELLSRFGSTPANPDPTYGVSYPNGQLVNWRDPDLGLYRALDFLQTKNRFYAGGFGARTPGKVNINTIWDKEILDCVAYARSCNYFGDTEVTQLWSNLQTKRGTNMPAVRSFGTPNAEAATSPYSIAASAVPKISPYIQNSGPDETLLKLVPATTSNSAPDQVRFRNELLSRLINVTTTRSNVFAVWATIGYFEVENDGPYTPSNPARLGKEIGSDQGQVSRDRFFFVLDRSKLGIEWDVTASKPKLDPSNSLNQADSKKFWYFGYDPMDPSTETLPRATQSDPITMNVPASDFIGNDLIAVYDSQSVTLQKNSKYWIDFGGRKEEVQLISITGTPKTQGYATIRLQPVGDASKPNQWLYDHDPGAVLYAKDWILGNPGPQKHFNYLDPRYSGVVRVANQIK